MTRPVGGVDILYSAAATDLKLRARLELASRLGALASDARDLSELFRALYDETARAMDAPVFLFALYDDVSQTVHVVRQMDRGEEHSGGSFPLGKGFTSDVIRTATPRIVSWPDEGTPIRLLYGTESGELVSPRSGVVVPILSGGRVTGVLSVQSYVPDAYDEDDLLTLSAIAAQASANVKRLRATEEMALEHERHAQELEAVLASMNDALVTVDARGAIVRLNRAARELLCIDGTSLVLGQPLERQRLEQWPATAREIASALVPVIESIRAGTSVGQIDVELKADERRVLSLGASVLRSRSDELEGGVIVFRDITAQRELERLREDIFAMAWHDMHTPITVIRGHAELLQRRLASGDRDRTGFKAAASLIVKHSDRLADLLTTLFDIRCLEAGVLSISRWPTDLREIVRDVAGSLRPTARHEIRVTADETVIGEWDERRIRQVITNLLANAMKYSPEGSVVEVSVSADETTATVRVRDQGIGLDGGELAQLFARGFRAQAARAVRGAGLGLYFGHGIVTAHGGRMWAESVGHGQGSTFCVSLPLHAEHGPEQL
jgi:two-component system, OmpR family, phosphate regulon sensor histidine kinase PhoR